jgi:uncharacterized protein (TIGR03083 family)
VTGDQEIVDRLEEVWTSIGQLGAGLDEQQWTLPTECPGWTVQDQIAHLAHIEGRLLGRADPDDRLPADVPHVRNAFGRANEVFVESRRGWPGTQVLAEFCEVTGARLAVLRSLTDDGFGAESWTPVGPGTVRELLPFRCFDSWVHEQDIRRAVGRPGDLDSAVAEHALGMVTQAMPFVIGKKVAPPEGTVVLFSLSDPLAREIAVGIVDGRARRLDGQATQPEVRLAMTTETYARLGCGRVDPTRALRAGDVTIDGDEQLGRRVLDNMNYVF